MEELEKRLAVLEAERSILSTLYAYAHTIDYGLKEAWLDLFTEDAQYRVEQFGEVLPFIGVAQPPEGLKGREVLSQYIASHTHAPMLWHKHFLVESVIELEGDGMASVESYFVRLDEDDKGAYVMAYGRYLDKMVKCPDGKWRFQARCCQIESRYPVRG
ncbi:MAG: nuclear transport factor 2 family protein [Dehalococcoidia bacterium]|nr:nuclear transport factor 2 family protein [Dehalococcoidia bacterium]